MLDRYLAAKTVAGDVHIGKIMDIATAIMLNSVVKNHVNYASLQPVRR